MSENYFSVFGVQPVLGRFFTQEDATGVGKDPYAVISYDYWHKRFGGNVAILGTPIRLHNTTVVIIGVAAIPRISDPTSADVAEKTPGRGTFKSAKASPAPVYLSLSFAELAEVFGHGVGIAGRNFIRRAAAYLAAALLFELAAQA